MCFIQIGNYPAALGTTSNMVSNPPISSQIIKYETIEYPQMDTFIDSENQIQNFGENEYLFLQNDASQKIVFLYYDLFFRPDFYSSVELIVPVSSNLGINPFSIWLISEEWKEATLTYENQPAQRQKLNVNCYYNAAKNAYQFNLTKYIGNSNSHYFSISIEYNLSPGGLTQLFSTEHLVNSKKAPHLSWINEQVFSIIQPTTEFRLDPKKSFAIIWEYRGRDLGSLTIELWTYETQLEVLTKNAPNNGKYQTRASLLSDYPEVGSFRIRITINQNPAIFIYSAFFSPIRPSTPHFTNPFPFIIMLLAVVIIIILLVKQDKRNKAKNQEISHKNRPTLEIEAESEKSSDIKVEIQKIPKANSLDPAYILTSILEHGIQKTFDIIREQIYAQGITDPAALNQKTLYLINETLQGYGYILK